MILEEKKRSAHELVRFFVHTDKLHKSLIEMRMSDLNLHRSQHIMLMCIAGFGKALPTQSMLAKKLDISAATAAVTLKKLETAGYICKSTSEGDCRCNRISITDKGYEILEKAKNIFTEIDSAMIDGVSEEELLLFAKCLEKFQSNLRSCGATLPQHIC